MVEPPSPSPSSTTRLITKDLDRKCVDEIVGLFQWLRISSNVLENMSTKDFYSNIVGSHLKSELIIDASVSRTGKTVTVVAVDFKFKESGKSVDIARLCIHVTFAGVIESQQNHAEHGGSTTVQLVNIRFVKTGNNSNP
ncbi:hypothetical protein Dsin_026172 [Dipteronia sinensis]|uniref:Uncharacterized protein n=1 Tax=Dipteronia sinensis TaxID=43782 RepID=A0AAD9ZXP8_9ROSI|nr:hypothetical protein Dsin_026172 [Dipteronia sinensis]